MKEQRMADNEVTDFDRRAFALAKAIDVRPVDLTADSDESDPDAIIQTAGKFLTFLEGGA